MSCSSVGRKTKPAGNEERHENSAVAAMDLVGRASVVVVDVYKYNNRAGGAGAGAGRTCVDWVEWSV